MSTPLILPQAANQPIGIPVQVNWHTDGNCVAISIRFGPDTRTVLLPCTQKREVLDGLKQAFEAAEMNDQMIGGLSRNGG